MSDINSLLGTNLFHLLEKLRKEKGSVTVEDAGTIVAGLMKAGNQSMLHAEIVQMIGELETVKQEMLTLYVGDQVNQKSISDASEHLDTVIKSTEEATNQIMDAASAIGTLATEIGGDKGQKLQDTCMRIYEACNFQDLATQRITRVIKLIRAMEGHITNLIKLFKISDEKTGGGGNGASLLNGPALPQDAISQSDVDALFKSLGG